MASFLSQSKPRNTHLDDRALRSDAAPQGAGICGTGQMFSSMKRKVGGALDMVVVTPEDIERFGDSPALSSSPRYARAR
jgi:hypothetical protein